MIFGSWKDALSDGKSASNLRKAKGFSDRCWRQVAAIALPLTGLTLVGAAALKSPFGFLIAAASANEIQLVNAMGEPHLAQRLPENTPYAMFVSVQDENLANLEQFELFAKLSDLFGGLTSPVGLPFLPPETFDTVEDWAGMQSAIALLPETAPRRVSPTDLSAKFYGITQIVNADEFVEFVTTVELFRSEAPVKKEYQGATLWVWPTRTETINYPDYESFEGLEGSESEDYKLPAVELKRRAEKARAKALTNGEASPPVSDDTEEDFYEDSYTVEVPGLVIAQVDGYAFFAQEAQTVEEAIAYQSRLRSSLATSELFLRSQYAQTPGAIAHIYANVSETSKFDLSDQLPDFSQFPLPAALPPDFFSQIFSAESRLLTSRLTQGVTLEGIIYPENQGLRLQGRLYGNEILSPTPTPDLPYAESTFQYVPAPAYTLGSGRNFAGFWNRVTDFLSLDQTAKGYLDQARSRALTFTGLDLDTELIGWIDQEIAFFSFPSDEGLINSVLPGAGIEIGLAIQTSDRAKAETALNTLGILAEDFIAPGVVANTLVNDSPTVSWRIPSVGDDLDFSFLGQSWVAEDTVMFTSGIGAMKRVLNATAFEPLDEHPTFLNATRSLIQPNNGYSYVNAGSYLSLIYGFAEDWFEIDANDPFFVGAKSYLGTVRSLSGTTASTDEYWQLDALIGLAPAERQAIVPPVLERTAETAIPQESAPTRE